MNAGEESVGTTPVREGYALDTAALERWMRSHVDGYTGPLTVEQFRGGQSNPTYKLVTSTRAYVLRRKPPGVLLKGAHAIEREARVMAALSPAGVPVATVFGLCTDTTVVGSAFYVMEMVEGRIFWDLALPGMSNVDRAALFEAMNKAIAQLHTVDVAAAGLSDFGRPANYLARQIARWSQQYHEDTIAGRNPHLDRLVEWLPTAIPADDRTAVRHGDFRIDNMIFHPTESRLLAVIDWELATLGHPDADFAYHAMMYRMPPHIVAGLVGVDIRALGLPSEQEYLERYCTRVGRPGMPDYDFYVAFSFFRLAAIYHGIKGRYLRGTAASTQAADRARIFPELAALAWQQAVRAGA